MTNDTRVPAAPAEAYCYLWSYRVRVEAEAAFLACYAPGGDWARLFARASGYRQTLLLRDHTDARRWLTIDCWNSKQAHVDFHARFAAEYAALDARCAAFTDDEQSLGEYAAIDRVPAIAAGAPP